MKSFYLIIILFFATQLQAQIVTIPDTNFKNALLTHNPVIDTNGDNEIQVSEAIASSIVNVSNKNISDLTGIEEFTNLDDLRCFTNSITVLDLGSNTNLTKLNCAENQLTTLDLTNNLSLTEVDCANNLLTTFTVETNNSMDFLTCNNNSLTSLTLSPNANYSLVECNNNSLTTIDLTNITITSGEGLNCHHNNLTGFTFSNSSIKVIRANFNDFISLDLNGNPALEELYCGDNATLTSINLLSNLALLSLDASDSDLSNLDLTANTNLTYLRVKNNTISSLDLSQNTALQNVYLNDNEISTLDVSQNTLIITLNLSNNPLTSLDLNSNVALKNLFVHGTDLATIDLSNNSVFESLGCVTLPNLTYINLKNGNNHLMNNSEFFELPLLETVCVDNINSNIVSNINGALNPQVINFTSYCSLTPGQSNQITGVVRLDYNNNGCFPSDLSMPNLMVVTDNGTETFATFTQDDGTYLMHTNEGNFSTTINYIPTYYNPTPASQTSNFVGFDNTDISDFCITTTQTVDDLNISFIPVSQARPGFEAQYQIVYQNFGTTQLDGNISLDFDGAKMVFDTASETVSSQTSNSLTFDYIYLNPFETRTIDVSFTLNTIPTTNIGDNLLFTATANPISGDATPVDNTAVLNQTVVGSYDPNDIHILEGQHIKFSNAGNYLHYTIRFQNTGTASAENVVVANKLDPNLDWNTLTLLSTSHQSRVAIKNGSDIEFIFENIDLVDSTSDEPNSHGFIAYKIKPKSDIAIGDLMNNQAHIFFDFNPAIDTNTVSTEIVNTVSVGDNHFANAIKIHPNPTNGIIKISSKNIQILNIIVYSKLGQIVLKKQADVMDKINLSGLNTGLYFVKFTDIDGNVAVRKVVLK